LNVLKFTKNFVLKFHYFLLGPLNLLLTNSGVKNFVHSDTNASHACCRDDAATDNGCGYTTTFP